MRPGEVTIRAAGPADGAVIATMIAEHGSEEGATIRGRAEDYAAALAAGRIGCLLAEVACIAVARGADRLDLVVRDVNRARGFYAGQGLRELAGWQVWRADPPELARLAGER